MQLRGTSHQPSHSRRKAWLHTDRPSTRQRGVLVVFSVARGSDAGPGGQRRSQRRRPSPAGLLNATRGSDAGAGGRLRYQRLAPFSCKAWLHTGRPAFDHAAWAAGLLTAARGSDAGAGGRRRRQRWRPLLLQGSDTPTDRPSTRRRGLLVFSPRHVALMPIPVVDCDVNGGVLLLRGAASHWPTGL